MHGIQEQASLASSIKADGVHRVMPLSVIFMEFVNIPCPCLEPVVSIADKKHAATQEVQVRVWSLKLLINWGLVETPVTSILILHRLFFPLVVVDGNIKHKYSKPVSMGELSFQPLDIIYKGWTN
jgi:hypothetical protein